MRKRMGAIALALALAFGIQGCFGKFNLVRKVYKFNGTVGNKWVNELVFLVFNIVPVYGVAGFIDAVVLNSIEFWSGKNPVTAKVVTQGDKVMAMHFDKATGLIKLSYFDKGELKGEGFLRKDDQKLELLGSDMKVETVAMLGSHADASLAYATGLQR